MTAEEFIKDYTNHCSNELSAIEYNDGRKEVYYHEWLTPDQALAAVELKKEEVIEKACEWLEPVFKNLAGNCGGTALIRNFKKAMEE